MPPKRQEGLTGLFPCEAPRPRGSGAGQFEEPARLADTPEAFGAEFQSASHSPAFSPKARLILVTFCACKGQGAEPFARTHTRMEGLDESPRMLSLMLTDAVAPSQQQQRHTLAKVVIHHIQNSTHVHP